MKKISILAFLFAGMLSFSSCESDRDSNPVLQDPTEFVLNTPAYVNTNSVGSCHTGFESLSLSQEEKESIPANRKANIEIFFISL